MDGTGPNPSWDAPSYMHQATDGNKVSSLCATTHSHDERYRSIRLGYVEFKTQCGEPNSLSSASIIQVKI